MSRAGSTLATIERLTVIAIRKHVGPKLYLLSAKQRAIWDEHQAMTSVAIETYEAKHGRHSYIVAVFNGDDPCADHQLPHDIRRLLGLDREPTGIPVSADLDEARRIYETIAHPNKDR